MNKNLWTLLLIFIAVSISSQNPLPPKPASEIESVDETIVKRQIIPASATAVAYSPKNPKYVHRGFMLDTARKFFPVSAIKNILTRMASAHMNVFHWHLTDNEGFNIWWSFNNGDLTKKANNGGYYTHQNIREIVSFAAKLNIEVVPEIEFPGHVLAWTKGYTTKDLMLEWANDEFDAFKPLVFDRLSKLLSEIVPLFNNTVRLHCAHDETSASPGNAYRSLTFARNEADRLKKTPIVWDDTITDKKMILSSEFTIQIWNRHADVNAIRKTHKVILSDSRFWYIGGDSEPKNFVFPTDTKNILGAELCWFTSPGDDPSDLGWVWRWIDQAGQRMVYG